MSIFTDLEKDAASVDGFVSENGLIPTRRNGPKPSYQYLVDGWNAEIAAAILEMNKSRGFRVVGTFEDGFTYELFNDVGIDTDGNSWIYVGAGAPNKVVPAGTVPSVGEGYQQVTFDLNDVKAVARSLNVSDSAVIYATNTTTSVGVGDGVSHIYDANNQTTWRLPSGIGSGETIVSVNGPSLITSGGNYYLHRVSPSGELDAVFKGDDAVSAVDYMISGYTSEAVQITHKIGNTYTTGLTRWVCVSSDPQDISGFKAITDIHVGDFGAKGDGLDIGDVDKILEAINSTDDAGGVIKFGRGLNYLIAASTYGVLVDKNNITLDLNGSTLKIEANGLSRYSIVTFSNVESGELRNGHIVGDKLEHDYSSGGTHEWGYGINILGSENVNIINVKSSKCTGDSCSSASNRITYIANWQNALGDFASGGIDDTGIVDEDLQGHYTVNPIDITSAMDKKRLNIWTRNFNRYHKNAFYKFTLFFYDNEGNFLSSYTDNMWAFDMPISLLHPNTAKLKIYFRDHIENIKPYAKIDVNTGINNSKNILIDNCEFFGSRRQGLTVGGTTGLTIKRTIIHDIAGTAPQSAIDIEENANTFITVSECKFYNNKSNFQSPSGVSTYIENSQFGETENPSSFCNITGSVTIQNCAFEGGVTTFDGVAVVKGSSFNVEFLGDISDPNVYSKVFEDCRIITDLIRFRAIKHDDCVFSRCEIKVGEINDSQFVTYKDCIMTNPLSYIKGKFVNTNINKKAGDLTVGPNTIVNGCILGREDVVATAHEVFTIGAGVQFIDSTINIDTGSYLSRLYMHSNSTMKRTTCNFTYNLESGGDAIQVSGDNVSIQDSTINHSGTWNSASVALVRVLNDGLMLTRCHLETDSVDAGALPAVKNTTNNYTMTYNSLYGCAIPDDDEYNKLGFNVDL